MLDLRESTVFDSSLTPAEITQILVDKGKLDPRIHAMMTADQYYEGHDTKISHKTRVYFDKDRNPIENPAASNTRIQSNFLRDLVQQKQDYAFAKSFIIKLSDNDNKEIELKDDKYGNEWKDFAENILFKKSYILSGQAVNRGIAWAYVWIDDDGKLQLTDVPANLVYPEWIDRQHTKLDRLVYNYWIEEYRSLSPTMREFAEYWSSNERILFDVDNGYSEEVIDSDIDGNPIHSQMMQGDNPVSWDKIPFIAFKGTDDEKPLLDFIKEQIDSYNELDSKSVDGLIDDLDPMLVLKGMSASVSDLIEARELAKMTRTISIDADGDAHYIQAQTQVQALMSKMEGLRKDIIKFGYGIDYQDARFGGNPNQLVIKSLYQNMDTYVDGLERHFQDFIDSLKYFFDKWYEWSGKGSFDEVQKYKVLIKLDRSMMINQSALIEDTAKLAGTGVSKKTVLEFNPIVQDVELEEERLKEEQKASQDNDLYNFAQRTNIENGGEYNTAGNEAAVNQNEGQEDEAE